MNNPVAITVFGIDIMWYGILISLGIILAVMLAMHRAKQKGIKTDDILDIALVAVPVAIICARLYYVIFKWDYYSGNLAEILNIRNGGLAIHGALIGGVLAGLIVCKRKKLKPLFMVDLVAPSLILGQAIGRWGNFMNNEAHGGPTDLPWAIEVDGVKVHPTFLYESLWNLAVMFFLLYYDKHFKKEDGELFFLYGILYSVGRFFIEGLRTDSLYFMGLRVAQLISLLIIVVFGLGFMILRSRKRGFN